MRVGVVGAGSIGVRHQRILQELGHQVTAISANSPSAKFKSLSHALVDENFDYVVIASKTTQHFDDLNTLIKNNFSGYVLIEKPLFDKPQKLQANKFAFSGVGYNLRFHPSILWLKETLPQLGEISSVNIYVGQYLPTWRPDIDYQDSSSAKVSAGGGVLRDLSHELDLVQNIFGDWQHLTALGGRYSNLEIETDDTFSILMQTEKCAVVAIQMNYLDRIKQRKIIVNGNNGTIKLDLIANSASFNNFETKFDAQPDSTYISEHNEVILKNNSNICSLSEALKVVQTIDAIEKSAKKQKWIAK